MNKETVALTLVPSPDHVLEGHPEHPRRFTHFEAMEALQDASKLLWIEPESATEEELMRVHPESYLHALDRAASQGPGFLDYGDTYATPASYQAALQAAGAGLATMRAVTSGNATSGFSLARPPGHHATTTRAMGFCLLNNVAIAAQTALHEGCERVLIIDFDVHHGNGTQDIFAPDPRVLYISTHQEGIYPGTGRVEETGEGDGLGSLVNVPLPAGVGDQAFQKVTARVFAPVIDRFRPDILLVSAGFDAHWNDPLAGLQLSTHGFYELARILQTMATEYCEGRIVYFLEGGYDPEALRDNVDAVFHALLGAGPPSDRLGPAPYPEPDVEARIQQVCRVHGLE